MGGGDSRVCSGGQSWGKAGLQPILMGGGDSRVCSGGSVVRSVKKVPPPFNTGTILAFLFLNIYLF